MGQVPRNQKANQPSLGIIGGGRSASHFSHYLNLLKVPHKQWTRKSETRLEDELKDCSMVFILIADDAIEPFIESNLYLLRAKTLVHFSGSLSIEEAIGFHPLMTFPKDEFFDLQTYSRIPFVSERGGPTLSSLVPQITNETHFISKKDKALYHALCVMSGNFSFMLWNKIFNDFEEKLKLPRQIVFPYLAQTFESIIKDSKKNMTGPLVRGDEKTIGANLNALREDPYFDIYTSFLKVFEEEKEEAGYEYQ